MKQDIILSALENIPEINKGTDLGLVIVNALKFKKITLQNQDIIVITQKIVSKAQGMCLSTKTIIPSPFAKTLAKNGNKDGAFYEAVLQESKRIVRQDKGILITQTHHGFTMANAGIDESNVSKGYITLLPKDPDGSANTIRKSILKHSKNKSLHIAVIISDTWGRPWRNGQINVCIGSSGIETLIDYRGKIDTAGNTLAVSQIAIGDEIASAAELIMGKIDQIPVCIMRGYSYTPSLDGSKNLIRDQESDLFR